MKDAIQSLTLDHFNLIQSDMMLAYFRPECVMYRVLLPLGIAVLQGRSLVVDIFYSLSLAFRPLSIPPSLYIFSFVESKRVLVSDYYQKICPMLASRPYLRHRVVYIDTGTVGEARGLYFSTETSGSSRFNTGF